MKKPGLFLLLSSCLVVLMASCSKDDEAPVAPAAPVATSSPTPCGTVMPSGISIVLTPEGVKATDRIHAFPVSISAESTVNALGFNMVGSTATNVRMALYTNTASTLPGILLSQSTGFQVVNIGAVTKVVIPAVHVAPDLYWVAVIFTGEQPVLGGSTAGSLRYYSGTSPTYDTFPQVMPAGNGTYSSNIPAYAYVCD